MSRWLMVDVDGDPFLAFEGELDSPPTSVALAGEDTQPTSSLEYAQEMAAEGLSLQYIASRMGSYNTLVPDPHKDKVAKSVYSVTTAQSRESAGYLLVDDISGGIVGYSGNPPTGLTLGQTVEDFQAMNRDLVVTLEQEAEEIDTTATAQENAALVGTAVGHALQASGVISKADEEQQIVYGWAYVTHDRHGNVVVDKSGDFIDEIAEIEKSALNFMLNHRASDLDHSNVKGGEVIESMVFTPEKMEAMGIEKGALPSGWWIGVKCSDEQWAGYKAGRTAFSVHGRGTRKAAD